MLMLIYFGFKWRRARALVGRDHADADHCNEEGDDDDDDDCNEEGDACYINGRQRIFGGAIAGVKVEQIPIGSQYIPMCHIATARPWLIFVCTHQL